MLFESVRYKDDLPFEISFLNIGEESKHCHKEVEILLVLRGVTHYQIYHSDYELNTGDLIIADMEDLHQIHDSSDDVLMLSMHIDTTRFEEIYPDIRYMFFVCEECMESPASDSQLLNNKLTLLKNKIAGLAFHYIKGNASPSFLMDEIKKVVAVLVEHFQGFYMEDYQYKTSQRDMDAEDLQQLCRITRYILLNYRNKISLDDIAKLEHLSSYYLSHLIKENLGFNFQNFVNAIRLEFAEKLLVFSNMTLMQISQDCGFSSPNYFNKCFSAWYGKTPAQYRKDYVPCERSYKNSFTQEEAFELLSVYLNDTADTDTKAQILSPEINFEAKDFESLSGPYIILDSIASLISFNQNKENFLGMHPSEIIVDGKLLRRNKDLKGDMLPEKSIVDNLLQSSDDIIGSSCAAKTFEDILVKKRFKIFLCGTKGALLNPDRMISPAYSVLRFLFERDIPEIKVFNSYAMVRSEKRQAIVFFNTYKNTDIVVHIPKISIPSSDIIAYRKFSDSNIPENVKTLLDSEKNISDYLRDLVKQYSNGIVTFPDPKHDIDFTLTYMESAILEFINI